MKDVQSEKDFRNIPLEKVGVSNIRYPIRVLDKENGFQHTVSEIDLFVDLPKDYRGTHMSRFIEVLNKHRTNMSLNTLEEILKDMKTSLNAQIAHITVRFPYFILKKSPVSQNESFMEYNCAFIASLGDKFDFTLEVKTPVHLLCPCSKEISDYGAHNQRTIVTIRTKMNKIVWIEEIVSVAENAASAPLFALLKREDEKYITEKAYDNPKFVEDVVRDVAIALDSDARVTYYEVEVLSYESIHNHNAYAYYHKDKSLNNY